VRLLLTLERPGRHVDVVVTADDATSVADVAAALATRDPERDASGGPWSLRLRATGVLLDPTSSLAAAGLRSGSTVALETVDPDVVSGRTSPPVAVLRVLAGPDAGREFGLPTGSTIVGRDRDVAVRLSDPMVSKQHARIVVTDTIEIVDLGSTNGIEVDGRQVTRAPLVDGTPVQVGDSVLAAVRQRRLSETAAASPVVELVRSPRVVPPVPEVVVEAPAPPGGRDKRRFPLVAMVAPLLMGAVLFTVTRNPLSLVFIALSPVIMVGTWLDARLTSSRTAAADRERFDTALAAASDEVRAALDRERELRLAAHPSAAEVAHAVGVLGPLVWSRRPEHDEFLTVSLGLATQPSSCEVRVQDAQATADDRARLHALAEEAATVPAVPVVADLRLAGGLGIHGPRESAVDVARACVLQLVGLHSPDEVAVAAFVSPATRADWQWLAWLPHTSAGPWGGGSMLGEDVGSGGAVLATLEALVESRRTARSGSDGPPAPRGRTRPGRAEEHERWVPPAVVVLVEDGTPVDHARLIQLAEAGPDAGVHVIWVARTQAALPGACRAYLGIGDDGSGTAGFVRFGHQVERVAMEGLGADAAAALARALAPVVDAGATNDDASDLPTNVSFLGLVGTELATAPQVQIDRWRESGSLVARDGTAPVTGRAGSLRAVVGRTATEPMVLDLRSQGPHALVGGTTGSGKSEFLQSWVLAMATAHSPDRVTFLLVDYKGGAAFADCVHLPHTVGLVTDLSPHMVRRALTSLRAELHHREHLLNRKGVKDLVSLERKGDPDAPPSLVIVVDEFAALATDVPEFVDGVVDVAQRGRSLGLHLILATQRPAGVIKDNLRANTNLRLALRMADVDDSNDVLGTPMAAHVDPDLPGRTAVRTGPGRVVAFQSAYVGGRTTDRVEPPRVDVAELGFGRGRPWPAPSVPPVDDSHLPTDIARVVANVRAAVELAAVPEPRKPWLATLAPTYDLSRLVQRTDDRLVLGVVDDPQHQDQRSVYFLPDREGNLAVYGAGGTGKSVLLRTLAAAATITPRGGPVHVYGLDFAGGALTPLEVLPGVGAIVAGDDGERVKRLLTWLRSVVEERSVRYAASRASTLGDYRTIADAPDEPRYLLLVDGFGAFRAEYESVGAGAGTYQTFQQILADGRAVGVHVALSADRPASVPTSVSSAVQRTVVLRMSDENAYLAFDAPRDVLSASSPPGRGIDLPDRLELQVAVLGGDPNLARQAQALERLARAVPASPARVAPPVRRLPELVAASELPTTVDGLPLLGVADDTLAPVGFEPQGTFLVSGPAGSGRSTAVLQLGQALRRWRPQVRLVHLAGRASALVGHPTWSASERSLDGVAALAAEVLTEVKEPPTDGAPPVVVVVEALTDFLGTPVEAALTELVKQAKRNGHLVVAESDSASWGSTWPLVTEVRSGRRGIALQPDQMEGDLLFRTQFPRVARTEFPPGRGLMVQSGRVRRIQLPIPDRGA